MKTQIPRQGDRPTARQLRFYTLDRSGWRRKNAAERSHAKRRRTRNRMARASRRANR